MACVALGRSLPVEYDEAEPLDEVCLVGSTDRSKAGSGQIVLAEAAGALAQQLAHHATELDQLLRVPAMPECVSITGLCAAAGCAPVHPAPSPILDRRRSAWTAAAGPGTAARALVHGQGLPLPGLDPHFHCRPLPTLGHRADDRLPAGFNGDALELLHSITSSARSRIEGGISMPSVRATRRLIASPNFVACWTGRSDGAAPLRILPT